MNIQKTSTRALAQREMDEWRAHNTGVNYVGPVPEGKRLWHTHVLPAAIPGQRGARCYLADETVDLTLCECGWHAEVGPHYVLPQVGQAQQAEAASKGWTMAEYHAHMREGLRQEERAALADDQRYIDDIWSSFADSFALADDGTAFRKKFGFTAKQARAAVTRMYRAELEQAIADWTLLGVGPSDRADWGEIEEEIVRAGEAVQFKELF
jgi:hypothetical protein